MSIQDYGSNELYPPRLHTGMHRSTIILALCAILGLIGSLILTVAFPRTDSHATATNSVTYSASQWPLTHAITPQSHPTSGTVTPVPTSSTPSTSPTSSTSPITPFPPLLWQEIAALQVQNRLLYYGNQYMPEIALTFDDGPNPYYTPQVLAVLQQYHIKATFFCIGRQVAQYPTLVKQEYEDGDVVGNHTWSHPNLTLLASDAILTQINTTSDAIQHATGVRPTFFRPPYGTFNAQVLTQVNQLGLTTIIWNDEARDWTTPGVDVISSRILGLAGNGVIILLHDGGGNRSQTVAALPIIITTLQVRGFKFVTLPQLIHDLPVHPASNVAPTSLSMPIYPTPTTVTPIAFNSTEPVWKRGLA